MTRSPSLTGSLLRGSFWAVAIRWVSKFMGLFSLAICARILTPADYGLVNMALVAVGFATVLIEFGLDASLIRDQNATSALYDTAWTLRILQTTGIALIIAASSPIAANVYHDTRVVPIMLAISASVFVGGWQNIYVVDFRKDLEFRQDFIFSMVPRVAAFVFTIAGVLITRDYWGLVIGTCAADLSRCAASYVMIKKRPNWSLGKWREMTHFSLWFFLSGLADFASYQFDRILIGALGGARQLGLYGVGREFAALPSTELVQPLGRALTPTLSKLAGEPIRQTAAIEKSLGGVMMLSVPIAVGLALIARDLIPLLFGPQWADAAPLVAVLSLSAMTSGFRATAQNVLVVVGRVKLSAMVGWIQAILVLSLIYPAYRLGESLGVAWMYTVTSGIMTILIGVHMRRIGLLPSMAVWGDILRYMLAAGCMYLAVNYISPWLPEGSIPLLIAKITLGAIIYAVCMISSWILVGRPRRSEWTVMMLLGNRLATIQERFRR